MKKAVIKTLFAVGFIACPACTLSAAPMIHVDSANFDVGTIKQGEQKSIKHTFTIKNIGTDTLVINKVRASCGCIAVGYDTIIPPNKEGKLTQEVNLGSYSGTVRKYVTVQSNAKNSPELRVSLGGTIRSQVGVEPSYLSLKPDSTGLIKQTLNLTTLKKDLKVTDVIFKENENSNQQGVNWQVSLPMHLTYKLWEPDTVFADGYIRYKLSISANVKDNKTTYGQFVITSNHPDKKELTLSGVILNYNKK